MKAIRALPVLAGVVVLVGVVAARAGAATLFADDFEYGDAGGWPRSGGSWSVVAGGSVAGALGAQHAGVRHGRHNERERHEGDAGRGGEPAVVQAEPQHGQQGERA
ncbi:hypothetical protein ACPPVO_53565 [Dactylosporangium sp. McL0621]|uniref:hypothetical protein n=1 Tax=Dactylosporangium sp. McL0621 TaxID=3415678 RepID=UPI003CF6223D